MTIHAYSQLYLSKASRAVGNMLHDAVVEFDISGTDFLKLFIQSDVAEQFESGNPKYIAGKSGMELFLEVMEKTTGKSYNVEIIKSYERSPEYWVGWVLTHYQWYSGRLSRAYSRLYLTMKSSGFTGHFTKQTFKRFMRFWMLTLQIAKAS